MGAMPLRLVFVRCAVIGLALVLWAGAGLLAPAQAFAFEVEETSDDLDSCEEDPSQHVAACPAFNDDDLPAALCWEDGSAGVAPPPSFPIAPDKIEGVKRCPFDLVGIGAAVPGRSGDQHPLFPSIEPIEPALIPGIPQPPRHGELILIPATPYHLVEADGVRWRLDRPPT